MKFQGNSTVARGLQQCKGPEAGVGHTYLKNSRETSVVAQRGQNKWQKKIRQVTGKGARWYRALRDIVRT